VLAGFLLQKILLPYLQALLPVLKAQKTLIKLPYTQNAETDHFDVQIEHFNVSNTVLKQ